MKVNVDKSALTPRIILTEDSGAAPFVALRPFELGRLINDLLDAAEATDTPVCVYLPHGGMTTV